MRRCWWQPETHAGGVTWISPDQQCGDKRVTNTPEITPGDGEITPDENLDTLIADINILSVGEMSTSRMTRVKEIGTLDDALALTQWQGPWLGFKMTMVCHIRAKLSLLWNTLPLYRMFPENFAKWGGWLQNEVAGQGKATPRFSQLRRHLSQGSRWYSYYGVYQLWQM